MINKVSLMGEVDMEPVISDMPSGDKVANFSLITSEYWVDKNSQKQSKSETHNITVYNQSLIKIVEKFVEKGSKIYVDGTIKTRKHTSSDGIEKNITEIVLQNYSHTIKLIGESNDEEVKQYQDLNKATLIGNVGSDPDVRVMPNGGKVANFSLATSEYWMDKNFQRQSRTEWHKIVVYNENLIKLVEKAVHKGSKIYLEGIVKNRKYTSQDGIERNITEIVLQGYDHTIKLLDSKPREANNDTCNNNSHNNQSKEEIDSSEETSIIDDDIPF